jgi:epoxyqueuosine reductase
MLDTIREMLIREDVTLFAPISLRDCRLTRPYLLERVGIADGTAIILAVPYLPYEYPQKNLSAYAAVPDYHLYFRALFDRLLPLLHEKFPENRFAGFADHSPIDEIDAALRAGLGVRGDNGLLLTEPYSSYVFLGEIITDAVLPTVIHTPGECLHCGACRKACPVGLNKERCLSALTQKKGTLTPDELALLHNHPLIWGCDTCQEACPYTKAAIKRGTLYRAPSFFRRDVLPLLNEEILTGMDENSFAQRAYAWRGRAVIERNLKLKKDP